MKNPKIPKNKTDFFKGIKYWRKIKTQIWGQNGRYTGILKNAKGGKYDKKHEN